MIDAALGPLGPLASMLKNFQDVVQTTGGGLTGAAYTILGAGVLYQCVRAWLDSVWEGDALGLIEGVLNAILVGVVISMLIANYAAICSGAWGLMSGVMSVMANGSVSGDTGTIIDKLYDLCVNTIKKLFDMMMSSDCEPLDLICLGKEVVEHAAMSSFLLIGFAITILLLLIYLIIMLLQVVRGVFQVGMGLLFLPITLGFYPLIDAWAMGALSMIASGIAHMGVVSFLLGFVAQAIDALVTQAAGAGFDPTGTGNQAISKLFGMLLVSCLMVIMALGSGAAVGYATSIFGAASGFAGVRSRRRGGGGSSNRGGGGSGSVSKDTPSAAPSSGGGAGASLAGATGTAGQAAATAGQAAAAVGSGGTTAAVGAAAKMGTVAASAASGAGKAGGLGTAMMAGLRGGRAGANAGKAAHDAKQSRSGGPTVSGGKGSGVGGVVRSSLAGGAAGFRAGVRASAKGQPGLASRMGAKAGAAAGAGGRGSAAMQLGRAGAGIAMAGARSAARAPGAALRGAGTVAAGGVKAGAALARSPVGAGVKRLATTYGSTMMHNH